MSRSVKIKATKWNDPEDITYLSFFGTLLHGLRMEETRLPNMRFELKRRAEPDTAGTMRLDRRLLPAPEKQVTISDLQRQAIKSVASVAEKANFVPKALPGNAETVIIEMERLSDARVPVYARS